METELNAADIHSRHKRYNDALSRDMFSSCINEGGTQLQIQMIGHRLSQMMLLNGGSVLSNDLTCNKQNISKNANLIVN
jgi:hypothetical protein